MRTTTISFRRDELIADVERMADLLSHDLAKESHVRHMLADICQDGNIDRVCRSMSLAYQLCQGFLHRFTRTDIGDNETFCNAFCWPEAYRMVLNVPDNFSEGAVTLVGHLVHEYICTYVLWDYLTLLRSELAAEWNSKLSSLEEQIKNAAQLPGGRYRRPLQPF